LWHHRQLRTLALLLGALTCLATAGEAILVLYAQQILGLSEVGYGVLISAAALGAVSGGILSSRIVDRVGRSTALVSAALTYSIAQLGLGLANRAWIFAPVMALGAFSAVTWNVVSVSLRQALVPDELRGRVNSAYRFFGWGAMPIGALLGALLANATNLHAPFIVGGLGMITATIIATPHLTHIDQCQINKPAGGPRFPRSDSDVVSGRPSRISRRLPVRGRPFQPDHGQPVPGDGYRRRDRHGDAQRERAPLASVDGPTRPGVAEVGDELR
jgi:MFS family permease